MQDIHEGPYAKKKKSVAVQFATVKYRPETYCWTHKLNRKDYGVDKNWVIFFFNRMRFAYDDNPGGGSPHWTTMAVRP